MWGDELYMGPVFIFCFSVVFPLFKLATMFLYWFLPCHTRCMRSFLRGLSYAGRFSLLDVFVLLMVITLAHNQGWFFTAIPSVGLYVFIGSILLNMTCSEIMCNLEVNKHDLAKKGDVIFDDTVILQPCGRKGGWRMVVVPIMLLGVGVGMTLCWYFPYIQVV